MKSTLYQELSRGYGYDTDEDDEWQREVMDAETY